MCDVDSINETLKSEFPSLVEEYSDLEPFPKLVAELEMAIGNYSSSVRNIKAGKCALVQYVCVWVCGRECILSHCSLVLFT